MLKKIILAIVVVGLVGAALTVGGGFYLYHNYKGITVPAAMFNGLTIGSTEADVKNTLPSGAAMSAKDVYKHNASQRADLPPGEDCLHYLARDQRTAGTGAGVKVYRVCFKDGKLADKKTVLSNS
jgi:hypothetical protein